MYYAVDWVDRIENDTLITEKGRKPPTARKCSARAAATGAAVRGKKRAGVSGRVDNSLLDPNFREGGDRWKREE